MEKKKCKYCNKKTDKEMWIDIDIPGIPICDDMACKIKLYIDCGMVKF